MKDKLYSIAVQMKENHSELHKNKDVDGLIRTFLNGSVLSNIAPLAEIEFNFPWYSATNDIAKKTRDIQRINDIAEITDTDPDDFEELRDIPKCRHFLRSLTTARNMRYSSDEVAAHLFAVGNYCTLRLMKEVYSKD